jgi:hypothetical protein
MRVLDVVAGRHWRVRSIQSGARTSGTPRVIRISQPCRSRKRWWNQQSMTPLSVWVGPPLA